MEFGGFYKFQHIANQSLDPISHINVTELFETVAVF